MAYTASIRYDTKELRSLKSAWSCVRFLLHGVIPKSIDLPIEPLNCDRQNSRHHFTSRSALFAEVIFLTCSSNAGKG